MNTTNITQTAAALAEGNSRQVKNSLDKDAFLKILVAQLSNQDPMNPMEDKDFIAQLAQFSVLEEIQTLNAGNSFSQASSLVGKNAYAVITEQDGSSREIFGKVNSALTIQGLPYLEINGEYVPYSAQLVIYDYTDPLAPAVGDRIPDAGADEPTETADAGATTPAAE